MDITLENYWTKVLSTYRSNEEMDDYIYNTFFSNTKLIDLSNQVAIVRVESAIQKNILTQNVQELQEILQTVLGRFVAIKFVLENEIPTATSTTVIESVVETKVESFKDGLRDDFTFENFIVGPSNRESHAASLATALNPGKYYNPLFIYGNSGLGKTHLLNALGNHIKSHSNSTRVKYIPCMEFVNSYIQAIRENKIDDFNNSYRNIDILLVDDIQFLAGKEKSHEVFFHLFNDLVNNRKQVVITSDRHPDELKGLEDRLVSRFSSGLSVGIDSPEFETALAILQNKLSYMSDDNANIDEDVLSYIASRFSSDIRRLEGALNRLIFYSITFNPGDHISLDVALKAFKGMDSLKPGEELTLEKIKNVVADYYGLTRQQIISKSRTSNIANARHIAIYLCRKHLDLPFTKIGEGFGKRDHSTIMSSYDKVSKLLQTNESYQLAIKEIEKILINK